MIFATNPSQSEILIVLSLVHTEGVRLNQPLSQVPLY